MNTPLPVLDIAINEICSNMGRDPLLVQGAGGNVSWKSSGVMWVKASGTCLAEARKENIFVPVDLGSMREALLQHNYSYKPQVLGDFSLRPSIETLLHGLMRHKVVIHVHLISALIHLIKKDARGIISNLVDGEFSWGYVDYCKPGPELAKAVSTLLKSNELLDVIFLGNHGVVIGADTVEKAVELVQLLDKLMGRGSLAAEVPVKTNEIAVREPIIGFRWCPDSRLHLLAQNSRNLKMVRDSWALFPDHVVFLGEKALIVDDPITLDGLNSSQLVETAFVFVRNVGVLQSDLATQAQIEQLICYYHVISNLDGESPVRCLLPQEIGDLLNWDAEVYRQSMVK
jgi:rhamnose utilization protein RhaD (predicted bifunctional aldolase and dehydrogenase)